jgi:hypothetical protein
VKKSYISIICLAAAIGLLGWSLGVASNAFKSPIFASFWWLNYNSAHASEFVALAIGGAVLIAAVNFWPIPKKEAT